MIVYTSTPNKQSFFSHLNDTQITMMFLV